MMQTFENHLGDSAFRDSMPSGRRTALRITWAVAALALLATVAGAADRTPSPAGADVYIISPKNGAKVTSPFVVRFGLKGMGVAPAGIKFDNTGHHHLLIDTDAPADLSAPLPATDKIVHFGKGQTETTLTLPQGQHTLQLLLADQSHVPHDPPVISKKITITVTK
jgi:Domain of unknown function (DUF4399)